MSGHPELKNLCLCYRETRKLVSVKLFLFSDWLVGWLVAQLSCRQRSSAQRKSFQGDDVVIFFRDISYAHAKFFFLGSTAAQDWVTNVTSYFQSLRFLEKSFCLAIFLFSFLNIDSLILGLLDKSSSRFCYFKKINSVLFDFLVSDFLSELICLMLIDNNNKVKRHDVNPWQESGAALGQYFHTQRHQGRSGEHRFN